MNKARTVTFIPWKTVWSFAALISFFLLVNSPQVYAQAGYEADVTPRPNGKNGAISQADYQQIGRFAMGTDAVNPGSEFQRADCAPRSTLGDGRIGMADLVQAMRYHSGLDPLTKAGGPVVSSTEFSRPEIARPEVAREVRVGTPTFGVGTITVPIELVALGNENALGFTLAYDQNALSNPSATLGDDAVGGLLLLNPTQTASGRLGVGIALAAGQSFAAGTRQILRVTFSILPGAAGTNTPIGFASSPVALEIADVLGDLLDQRIFTGISVPLVNPLPKLTSLSPNAILINSPSFDLQVTGADFVLGSVVQWNGTALATTYKSATSLVAVVPANLLVTAGVINITVFTPTPGGGLSTALPFEVRTPPPGPINIGVGSIASGSGAGSFSVFGSNFVPGALIHWNGRAMPTRFISPTQLIVDYSAADIACAGMIQVTIVNPPPGGGTSNVQTFTIKPSIVSMSPTFAAVGGGSFTLTVNGTGFCTGTRIRVNGVSRDSTIVGLTQITTTINAAELTAPTTLQISVITSDGIASDSLPLTVCASGSPKITMDSVLDFGLAAPAREPIANRASRTFTVENTGCQALTISFATRRTGEDVASGKITNTDDSGTFILYNITGGVNQEIHSGNSVTIGGFQTGTFRIVYDPKIPAPAGRVNNLAASQVIPDVITSTFSILQGETTLRTATLTGRVESNSRLINPLAPRLAPLVVFNKTGSNEFTVEASGYDANSDIHLLAYQFYDQAGNRIGQAPNFNLDLRQAGLLKGQSFSILKKFTANESGLNAYQVRVFFYDREDYAVATSGPIGTGQGRILNATSVSAASYSAEAIAADGIVSVFGEKFGTQTVLAQASPLPRELGNTRVYVTDANQVERLAPLFFVSPTQINYLIPEGTIPGEAKVVVVNTGEVVSEGTMRVAAMAPALFTANADGKGAPAAYAVRVKRDNSQITEPVAQFDAVQGKFVPAPINLGPAEEQVFLVLFGTGIRHRSAMNRVSARIAGVEAEVHYAGPQGQYYGLDQVNLRIPRSALVSGEVDLLLTVDGKTANPVRIHVR